MMSFHTVIMDGSLIVVENHTINAIVIHATIQADRKIIK